MCAGHILHGVPFHPRPTARPAYGVGLVAMIPCFSTGLYTGPAARALGGADIAMLVGLPVAAAVYLFTCRSIDLKSDRARAAAADIGLDPADNTPPTTQFSGADA